MEKTDGSLDTVTDNGGGLNNWSQLVYREVISILDVRRLSIFFQRFIRAQKIWKSEG